MLLLIAMALVASCTGMIMPITTKNGSLDASSLLSRIVLMEQTLQGKASADEVVTLKSQLETMHQALETATTKLEVSKSQLETMHQALETTQHNLQTATTKLEVSQTELKTAQNDIKELQSDLKSSQIEIAVLKSTNAQCSCNTSTTSTQLSADFNNLRSDVSGLKTDIFQLQSFQNTTQNISKGGAVFTRWGRTMCPKDSKVVYKGYTGGTWFGDKASSATILCLSEHPIYANHTSTTQGAHIYGTEYVIYSNSILNSLNDDDMPCVVCQSNTRRSAIMVPARNQCHAGWSLEYQGYLFGPLPGYASGEYICVDKDPEAVPGGQANMAGQLMYMVQSRCGSLPCPPYVDNWELTCAVCSR